MALKINPVEIVEVVDLTISNPQSAQSSAIVERETLPVKQQHNLPAVAENPNRELTVEETAYCAAFANVIRMYKDYLNKHGKDEETRKKFITLYNHNAFPNLIKHTGPLGSWKTIETWKRLYKESGNDIRIFAKDKKQRGSQVPPEQAAILIECVLNPNQPLVSEAVRMAMDIFTMKNMHPILSPNTYRRFIKNFKKENYADWVFLREGESALNDKCLPYLERDYDKIDVGDIIVADGHVLNFEVINPLTGKPKRMMLVLYFDMKSSMPLGWEVSPTENTFSIAVALRRSILRLGKMPKIVYMDNGRAFNSKYFTDSDFAEVIPLFERLGIKVITAIPYHGQSKTIERFFRSFAELERMIPTYCGTSIELQPPRMNRGEKLHNKLYDKMMFGTSINIFQAHQVIAAWFDKFSNRIQQDGHLKGITPAEIFNAGKGPGVDKKELTFLMMQAEVKTLYRNGIRMFNTSYWNEALFGKQWNEVLVRYDLLENDSIFVYDNTGEFVCEAKRIDKVHPAAGILGTEEDVKQLHSQLERKESLKKLVVGDAKNFLQNEIYPAAKRQFNEINIVPLDSSDEQPQLEESVPINQKGRKKKSLIDRWGEASIEPKNKRAMEA